MNISQIELYFCSSWINLLYSITNLFYSPITHPFHLSYPPISPLPPLLPSYPSIPPSHLFNPPIGAPHLSYAPISPPSSHLSYSPTGPPDSIRSNFYLYLRILQFSLFSLFICPAVCASVCPSVSFFPILMSVKLKSFSAYHKYFILFLSFILRLYLSIYLMLHNAAALYL